LKRSLTKSEETHISSDNSDRISNGNYMGCINRVYLVILKNLNHKVMYLADLVFVSGMLGMI
jgi:hypothetical protein